MNTSDLIQPRHLERRAAIYVRQSNPHQVLSHQESLRLQYALKQRALDFGWREHDVQVIDADLGQTAATMENREGYQKLVAQITLGEIGIVIAYDATRLARNCSHWYQLLDLCGHADCLIGDRDGTYDPSSINGRLLLGLKGQISELELHTIRARLTAGLISKAQRGELPQMLPAGLERLPSGVVAKHPDQLVQDRLNQVFDVFLRKTSLNQVVAYFREHDLRVPRKESFGDVRWTRATPNNIGSILHNPAYAGAFVYGRTRCEKSKTTGKRRQTRLPPSQWKICVRDKYPAYISWETFEKIQAMLQDNYGEYRWRSSRGVPREGEALLHGLAYCGQCGYKLRVRYEKKNSGAYICSQLKHQHGASNCQHLPIAPIDDQAVQWFFDVLSVAEIDLAATTLEAADRQQDVLLATQRRELERLRYQARLAERQYQHTDPENRLVASELERRWEIALQELKEAEAALTAKEQANSSLALPADLVEALQEVGPRLPELWEQGLFRASQKKALLRSLIDKVVLHRVAPDQVRMRVVWRGGAATTGDVSVHVNRLAQRTDGKEIEQAIERLAHTGQTDEQIAEWLTSRGYRSPLGDVFLPTTVGNVRRRHGIFHRPGKSQAPFAPGYLTVRKLAEQLGVPLTWIYERISKGVIRVSKDARTKCYLFPDNPATLGKMRQLRRGEIPNLDF